MRRSLPVALLLAALCAPSALPARAQAQAQPRTFTNPIVATDSADPWVVFHDGWYYLTWTPPAGGLWVRKSRTLTGLGAAEPIKVWTAPATGPQSRLIWAPELHFLRGKWYLYYTASDGEDRNHRHYVLEASDPLGPYTDRGRVDPSLESYAIDGSVLQAPDGSLYWMYTTGSIEIAPMTTPWQVDGSRRVRLTTADRPWERGWVEAPEPLVQNGQVFIVYSAGHSATPHYVLGLLRHTGGSLLDPANWQKSPVPVFAPTVLPEGAVYTTGHGGFTRSPDGKEDWMIYHGKDWRDPAIEGFGGRLLRAQRFSWKPDGTPDFGYPIPSGVPLPVPSGE